MKKRCKIIKTAFIVFICALTLANPTIKAEEVISNQTDGGISNSTGEAKAPEYKSDSKISDKPAQNKPIEPSNLGERETEKKPDNNIVIDNNKTESKNEGTSINFDKIVEPKKKEPNSVKEEKSNTKKETKKEVKKETKKEIKRKPPVKINKDEDNINANELNSTLENNNTKVEQQEEQTQQNSENQQEQKETEQPNKQQSSKIFYDFIYPIKYEDTLNSMEERRNNILSRCDSGDIFMMNKLFFEIYYKGDESDVTHYDSLSPIIYNKRTGNKSQYITRGEMAITFNNILSKKISNPSYTLPYLDTKDTIFEKPVSNMVQSGIINSKDFIEYDAYNLLTWGEFKKSLYKLEKIIAMENKTYDNNFDTDFYNKYRNIYGMGIKNDVFISKTMFVRICTQILSTI